MRENEIDSKRLIGSLGHERALGPHGVSLQTFENGTDTFMRLFPSGSTKSN